VFWILLFCGIPGNNDADFSCKCHDNFDPERTGSACSARIGPARLCFEEQIYIDIWILSPFFTIIVVKFSIDRICRAKF
jgi:hypothetical protein